MIEEIVSISPTRQTAAFRTPGSFGSGPLRALGVLVFFGLIFCQSPFLAAQQTLLSSDKPVSADSRRSISLLPQLPSMLSSRPREAPEPEPGPIYNDLPGFGQVEPVDHEDGPSEPIAIGPETPLFFVPASPFNPAYGSADLGGSLSLTLPSGGLVPAMYIEGEGYVPIAHPSIRPYLDPATDRPETNPNIVLVPEYRLAGYRGPQPSALESSRVLDTSGPTLLFLPPRRHVEPIVVSAQNGWSKSAPDHDILFLEGDCCIRQGSNSVQGPQAVVWIHRKQNGPIGEYEVTAYLESENSQRPLLLEIDPETVDAKVYDRKWFGRLTSTTTVQTLITKPEPPKVREPAIYHRALEMLSPDHSVIRQMQYVSEASAPASPAFVTAPDPPRFRRISLSSRGDSLIDIRFDPFPNHPDRGVAIITKGLNLIIEGVTDQDLLLGDVVDISADHAVIWGANPSRMGSRSEMREDSNLDYEVYLEGNIIFRDGDRVIEANRMYYDAKNKIAYILDGSLTTPIVGLKGISGTVRLKAEILQQLGDGLFTAKNTLVTTSQLGQPTYALHSRSLTMRERFVTPMFGGDEPIHRQILTTENNYLAVQTLPVFYWPWLAVDLKDPTFYIKNIAYGNSDDYGNQIRTLWNPFQLLNIRNRPDWLDADLALSWLEKRGFGYGTTVDYNPSSCFCLPGRTNGQVRFWGLNDRGEDRLGGRRRHVEFPHRYRYRVDWTHRQELGSLWHFPGPWKLTAQVGKTSDRNFLNNYFNSDWHARDNATTALDLEKICGNSSMSLFTEYALDDFYTNANWLPRFDHYWLGQSLLHDRLTWYEHTRVGLVNYQTATAPSDWEHDGKYFRYLPWELVPGSTAAPPDPSDPDGEFPRTIDATFEVFSTRHELDLPLSMGPFRVVPYVLGDFSHWGEDRKGQSVQRLYGQTGVRLNLPFWKVRPDCSSRTWYVNGLAHKIDFDAEFLYARSDTRMDDLILTDSLDNWSIEDFRRRYTETTFKTIDTSIPVRFDPRFYALRSGAASSVSARNMEIADDLTMFRFGMTHRWQTKRGPVGRRHIIDWITFSTHFNYYPEHFQYDVESQRIKGESVGLIDYDFLWHVGDRFSLFSSGLYDTFSGGQRITRVGGRWNRPRRGSFSLALDQLQGIINRNYLTMSVQYVMNSKYSMMYSTSYDIKNDWRNVGHNFMFTRTGESFRIFVGAVYNESKEDWSISFGLEPVFMKGIASKMRRAATSMSR